MSDSDGALVELGSPRRAGDNWRYAVRPAQIDATDLEILTDPDPEPGATAERPED